MNLILQTTYKIIFFCVTLFYHDTFAQWKHLKNSGYSGSVYSLASDGTQLFAGTAHGVFQSNLNNGDWQQYNSGLTSPFVEQQVNCFLIDGLNIFAGTILGLYVSPIDSESWVQVGSIAKGFPINTEVSAMIKVGSNYFVATEGGGIYISNDFGKTWNTSNNGFPVTAFLSITSLLSSGNAIYAGTESYGIFQSLDNGITWNAINNGLAFTNNPIRTLASNSSSIFAGTEQGIFLTANQGGLWTNTSTGFPAYSAVYSILATGGKIYAGTLDSGIYVSIDQGTSWTFSALPSDFVIIEANNILYAGTGDGLYSSSDGTTWKQYGSQLTNIQVSSLTVQGDTLIAGGDGGVFFSTLDSVWSPFTLQHNVSLVQSPSHLFYSTGFSVNDITLSGNTWSNTNSSLFDIYALFMNGDTLLAGGNAGTIYYSTNSGVTWLPSNQGLSTQSYVTCFAKNKSSIFAGTNIGLYQSKDGGKSWSAVSNGLPPNTQILSLYANGNRLYAGAYYGLYWSENYGQTWNSGTTGLPQPLFNLWVKSFTVFNGLTYAATNYGIYCSNDGTNWAPVEPDLPFSVFSLAIWHNQLVAGTSNWVYSVPFSLLDCGSVGSSPVTDPIVEMPNVFTPNDDDKNPVFKPITYENIRSGYLTIVNRWGQQIFQTSDPESGWDGGRYDAGIYYFSLHYLGNNGYSGMIKGWVQIIR